MTLYTASSWRSRVRRQIHTASMIAIARFMAKNGHNWMAALYTVAITEPAKFIHRNRSTRATMSDHTTRMEPIHPKAINQSCSVMRPTLGARGDRRPGYSQDDRLVPASGPSLRLRRWPSATTMSMRSVSLSWRLRQ